MTEIRSTSNDWGKEMNANGNQLVSDKFDYEQLEEATVATGKFSALTDTVWFLTQQGEDKGTNRYVSLNPLPFRVGRRSDMSLCLPFQTVSSLHAEIFRAADDTLWLRDVGSTNGSFLNGNPVKGEIELTEGDLIQFANIAFRLVKHGTICHSQTAVVDAGDQALALTRFDELLSKRAVIAHFQPIVDLDRGNEIIGYEVLGRSRLFGLHSPKQMFLAASQLNLECELSRLLRYEGIQTGKQLPGAPPLFVNTHPLEMHEPEKLYDSLRELRKISPDQSITLEIHESAAVDPDSMKNLRDVLDGLDMQLAYDDFGAGQARLVELVRVSPDYLKFDMTLVQHIYKATPQHQQMLGALVQMARGLGIKALAEGVECENDSKTCHDLGFEFGQGFYYGRPAPAKTYGAKS